MHSTKTTYPHKIDETYFTGTESIRDDETSYNEDALTLEPDIKIAFFYSATDKPEFDSLFTKLIKAKLEQQHFISSAETSFERTYSNTHKTTVEASFGTFNIYNVLELVRIVSECINKHYLSNLYIIRILSPYPYEPDGTYPYPILLEPPIKPLILKLKEIRSSFNKVEQTNEYVFSPSEMAAFEHITKNLVVWSGLPVQEVSNQVAKFMRGATPEFTLFNMFALTNFYTFHPGHPYSALTDPDLVSILNRIYEKLSTFPKCDVYFDIFVDKHSNLKSECIPKALPQSERSVVIDYNLKPTKWLVSFKNNDIIFFAYLGTLQKDIFEFPQHVTFDMEIPQGNTLTPKKISSISKATGIAVRELEPLQNFILNYTFGPK